MNLSDFLFGSNEKTKQKSNFNPQQNQFFQQFMNQLMNMGGGQGQGGGLEKAFNLMQQYMDPNSQAYKDFEQPYLNEFNEQTLPGIAKQFAGASPMGAGLMSSDFGQAMGGAASQYKSNLAGMKQGLQQKSLMDFINTYLQQSQMAMGAQPFSYVHSQGSGGFIPNLLTGAASGFASGFGQGYGKSYGAK